MTFLGGGFMFAFFERWLLLEGVSGIVFMLEESSVDHLLIGSLLLSDSDCYYLLRGKLVNW